MGAVGCCAGEHAVGHLRLDGGEGGCDRAGGGRGRGEGAVGSARIGCCDHGAGKGCATIRRGGGRRTALRLDVARGPIARGREEGLPIELLGGVDDQRGLGKAAADAIVDDGRLGVVNGMRL